MDVGTIKIDPVYDGRVKIPVSDPNLAMPAEAWLAHPEVLDAERENVVFDFGGFLIRAAETVALVDTGIGPVDDGRRRGGAYIENLAALDVTTADITDVIFTHLHGDHIGWASLDGDVVFPRATYRCHTADWTHFYGVDERVTTKFEPLTDRLEFWSEDAAVLPGIDVLHAPGHTPGSSMIVVSSGADRALLVGDVVHCPMELLEPEWQAIADVDPDLARRTRETLIRELEASPTPIAAAHFPGLDFGRLITTEVQRSWVVG